MSSAPPEIVKTVEPGIVCFDIERMLRYYTEVLGLRIVSDARTPPELSGRFGATPQGYRIVRLETSLGYRVKLVQPAIAPERRDPGKWVMERAGIAYLTFVVADLAGVVARLRRLGVRMVSGASDAIAEIRPGIRAAFTLDPEDNYLEFIEYV
jgi:catechol 2,3-dioxygenase-like lactoylglutathione lyase family enzyme